MLFSHHGFILFRCRLTLVTALNYGFLIPIFAGLLFIFVMSCLLRTAWSDPGIIPRATAMEASYIEKALQGNFFISIVLLKLAK